MSSRSIWKLVCDEAHIWYDEIGSLHVGYTDDEKVLEEISEIYGHRSYQLLNADEVINKSPFTVKENLSGGLYSDQELIVDPRIAIAKIPELLTEKYGVAFLWNKVVADICYPAVFIGNESLEADEIFVCSGADFETLYPQIFSALALTKCKLQMMRLGEQPRRIGPAVTSVGIAANKPFVFSI